MLSTIARAELFLRAVTDKKTIRELRDEIANLHLLADRLARKSAPYHDLVEAADAMRALFPKAAHDCLLRECSIVDAYDTARDLCLASRSPSHELVEAADALRNEMTMPSDGSFAPFVDRSLKDKIEAYDTARARELESALLAHRQAVALAYGLPLPPDGSENGGGERGEAARGAEPRPLVLTHPAAIDFGGARVLCRCGHTFPLRDSRELTHFVACPACKRSDRLQRVENLLRTCLEKDEAPASSASSRGGFS